MQKLAASRKRTLAGYKDEDQSVATKSGTKTRRLQGDVEVLKLPETEVQLRKVPTYKVARPEECDDSESTSSEGRQRRRERSFLEKQVKKRTPALCGLPLGRGGGETQPVGGGSGVCESQAGLLQTSGRPPHLCEGQRASIRVRRADRQGPSRVLQHEVQGGRGQFVWGLHPTSADPSVRTAGQPESASGLALSTGMEEVVSLSLKACLPSCRVVRSKLADGGSGALLQGSVQPPPGLNVSSARSFVETEEEPTRGVTSHWSVVSSLAETSDISKTGTKDDSVLIDSQWMAFAAPLFEWLVQGDKMEFVFKFDYSSYLKVFREACQELAKQAKRCPLREGRTAGSNLAKAGCGSSNGLPSSRALHRGNYARPSLSGDPSPWPVKKGAYFADLFAGSGRIGRAANALGFQTRSWELAYGNNHDLTDRRVLSKIKFDITKRLVLGGMLAPPCLTFSVARDRAGLIRASDFPWGLPDLSDRDQEKVSIGNKCTRAAFAIIQALDSQQLPWVFEHPHSSKVWFLPELQRLQCLPHVQVVVTDFCMWGEKWRKRTRFLLGNVAEDDAAGCSRTCQGKHGLCSRTGLRHIQLTGKDVFGRNLTQVAQPYPHRLCHRLVRAALSQYMVVPYHSCTRPPRP